MQRYIVTRLIQAFIVLWLISIMLFGLINNAPGDPVATMLGYNPNESAVYVSQEDLARQRALLGLDKPWPVRYALWLGRVVQGDLGVSFVSKRPVAEMIGPRIFPTLLLMGTATLLALLIGVPLGIVSALKQYSKLDHLLGTVGFLGVSVPGFFLAIIALYIFSLKIPLFPAFGMKTVMGQSDKPLVLDVVWHMVLPVAVLTFERIASYMRYVRAAMREVLASDYVRTARAKGLKEQMVVARHMFRNALLPLVTLIGLSIPYLFGGAVLIETIFAWPGLGSLGVEATGRRDYPVVMAFNLMIAGLVLLSNLTTDIVTVW